MKEWDGTKTPTEKNRYQARDGLYYNGYCGSPDWPEDVEADHVLKEMRKKGADPFIMRGAILNGKRMQVMCRSAACPGGCAVAYAEDDPELLICLRHEQVDHQIKDRSP
jgi:hypothetical protein